MSNIRLGHERQFHTSCVKLLTCSFLHDKDTGMIIQVLMHSASFAQITFHHIFILLFQPPYKLVCNDHQAKQVIWFKHQVRQFFCDKQMHNLYDGLQFDIIWAIVINLMSYVWSSSISCPQQWFKSKVYWQRIGN